MSEAMRHEVVRHELPAPSATALAAIFRRVAREPVPAMLDSAGGPRALARYSLLAFDPFQLLVHQGGRSWKVSAAGGLDVAAPDNPFLALRQELARWTSPPASAALASLPAGTARTPPAAGDIVGGDDFTTGLAAIGFLGYELGRQIEKLPASAVRDIDLPEMFWAFYDSLLVIDQHRGRAEIRAANLAGRPAAELIDRWRKLIDEAAAHPLAAAPPLTSAPAPSAALSAPPVRGNFTRDGYCQAVARAIEYIAAGDIFQVNLSQRFTAPLADTPAELYLRLRTTNPAPFAAYLAADRWAVLSSSPERYLKLVDGLVATRPIKGTRPRRNSNSPGFGPADADYNREQRQALIDSPKEAAELAMIVDLERNDLGRVCSYGTVRVTERRTIEEYATVFHSVAQVKGRLHAGHDLVDLLRATFPGGSITGAPKIRAMQIIDELEPTCRSVYTGAVGYLGFDGRADLNLAIRTLLVDGPRVHLQVGGGIVADSLPAAEYDETLAKARSLLEALNLRPSDVG